MKIIQPKVAKLPWVIVPINSSNLKCCIVGARNGNVSAPDSTFMPVYIARIGDGNIIRTGDGSDLEDCYCFHMKPLSAIVSGQIISVVSTASDRHGFICAGKHN